MRIKSEDEILDIGVRKTIIEEIEGTENIERKAEAFRRWQVYKDHTSAFVIEMLLHQFDRDTVREMSYSITNISIVRKIINKLSRVYSNGVQRTITDNEEATNNIELIQKKLKFNKKMITMNRILKLQKNGIGYMKPCPFLDKEGEKMMRIRLSPLNPYLYDVIEEFYDRTEPLVYILSDYQPGGLTHTSLDPAKIRLQTHGSQIAHTTVNKFGDNQDQLIADKKEDEGARPEDEKEYIWWSDKYHFTTRGSAIIDERGDVINLSGPDDPRIVELLLNPIEEKPMVNFAIDQDNSFWAEGGEDIVDSGITVNSMLSQINHVGVVQGYGQFVMTGKDLPKNQILGVNRGIILEFDPNNGDPKPEVQFINSNAPLRELMENTLSLVALTLTTNDLSVANVSASLDGGGSFPSAIAMLIDKADSMEDVEEQAEEFICKEPDLWRIYGKWQQVFAQENILDPELEELSLPEDFELEVIFNKPNAVTTEDERLNNLEKRKALGFNLEVELLMKDQPGLTKDQAEEKLIKIKEEKKANMEAFGPIGMGKDDSNKDDDESDDESDEDDAEDESTKDKGDK